MIYVLFIIAGIFVLYFSGEFLVRGSSIIAAKLGLSQFFIGLTVVALGTSLPEFFVSLNAVLNGSDDISFGNILGSNSANIGIVLALAFLLLNKIKFNKKDIIYLIFFLLSTFLFYFISFFKITNRFYSIFLIIVFLSFIYISLKKCKNCSEYDFQINKEANTCLNVFLIIIGIGGLYFGSDLLVLNGIKLARLFGVSEILIGATVMAVGTSLPELTTSIVSIIKKNNDIAIANVLGSNIFNVFFAFGTVSLIRTVKINPHIKTLDFPFLIVLSIITVFSFYLKKFKISGFALLLTYIIYVILIINRN